MSSGKINKILTYTKKCLDGSKKTFKSEEDLNNTLKEIFQIVKEKYPETTIQLMVDIFNRLFNKEFSYKKELDDGYYPEYLSMYSDVEIPPEYQDLENHFQKLKALPQPEQRTPEWFAYRKNRITASDTAAAIDENPYEPVESFIVKKCDPDHKFLDNANVYHGKKFELIATKIYEHIYDVQVFEFGALPSEVHAFLGASPDGICSAKTLSNKFSPKLGTMLEIKCVAPNGRTIETSGNIKGHICPYYYYLQVQQQLECCELEICDFWQCKLIEFKTREDYLLDECLFTQHSYGIDGKKMIIDNRIKKGVLLQFYPKKWEPEFDGDEIEWKSKFIYPPRLDMNNIQYDQWMCKTLSSLNKTEPELMKDYYFNKIIYWKLEQSHNQPIARDRKLFAALLPVLIDTWSKVKYYREHLDELPKLREIVEKRKKYIKTNTDFKINNDVIKNGVLFLEDYKHSIVKKTPVSKNLKNDEDCDFIDEPITKEKLIPKTKESVIKTVKTIPKKQAKKKEESDKEDNGEYKVTKTTFKKTFVKETECEFID
jgi:putative phage-type endonuclease